MAAPATVFVSVGSNLGERRRNCERGLALLAAERGIRLGRVSPFYRTQPVDFSAQDWFVNAAAEAATTLAPLELLRRLQAIERALGRDRSGPRFGPRTLDLDLLFYDAQVIDLPGLSVPHPRLHQRRFVLRPMCDLCEGLRHPRSGETLAALLARLPLEGQALERIP
jgi:2-amino-4-hydroxy-6-hydroxymethyldihydropteridine diphosphokinase